MLSAVVGSAVPLMLYTALMPDGVVFSWSFSCCSPLCKINLFCGNKSCLDAAQDVNRNAAVTLLGALCVHEIHGRISYEICNEEVCRSVVNLKRCSVLLENAVLNQAYLCGQSHGFHLIVGNVHEGLVGSQMKPLEFSLHCTYII